MTDRLDLIVVGAGPCGIAVGATARKAGLSCVLFDKGCITNSLVSYPYYMTFFSTAVLLEVEGVPFTIPNAKPDRREALAYYRKVVEHWKVDVRQYESVEEVFGGEGDFTVRTLKSGGKEGTYLAEAVVIATGGFQAPNYLGVPGEDLPRVHHYYHEPYPYYDQNVLVVGGGNSGCDIACDAAQSADRAFISLRRGYHFIPKYVLGKPSDVFAHTGPTLPAWLEQRVFSFLIGRLLVGDLTKYGLPKPDHPILESHPIMNTEILEHLEKGRLEVRPDIEELRGDSVAFTDGTEERIDLILWATGYERRYPFLDAADLDIRDGAIDLFLNSVSSAPPRSVLHRPVRDGRRGIPTIRPSSRPHSTLPRCAPGRGLGRRVRPTAGHGVSRPEGWAALRRQPAPHLLRED